MKNTVFLEVENINYQLHDMPVLENISFQVSLGDYVGIIGPNGAGKTTLLKIILGLLKPASGQIKLFGVRQANFKDWYMISYIPQRISQSDFYFPATVSEIVESGRTARVGFGKRFSRIDKKGLEIEIF